MANIPRSRAPQTRRERKACRRAWWIRYGRRWLDPMLEPKPGARMYARSKINNSQFRVINIVPPR